MRVLISVSICQFQTIDDTDLNDLKIHCTEKLLTPVLTKFALKYGTMALSCNRDFLNLKIVWHANENTLKIGNVR